ncbi:hypothetical protein CYCD_23670 [Tenuifilaceae bacterium CYCD]|nr:hypothetical protein CYCD_23670 [Tenuifilaceae bacterium CYCD]
MDVNFKRLESDMDDKCEMLTEEEILVLAKKINEKVNLPVIKDEEKELTVFCKVIRLVDRALYNYLPNEYYELIHDATDGISEADAEVMRKRLVPLINKKVNFPFLSEDMEEFLIDLVLKLILNALVKGNKLAA